MPEDKIISRYHRSISMLHEAIQYTNRAYIFDNSGYQNTWIAEITHGKEIEFKTNIIPNWFQQAVIGKYL